MNASQAALRDQLLAWGTPYAPLFTLFAVEAAYSAEALHIGLDWVFDDTPELSLLSGYDQQRFEAYYVDPLALVRDLLETGEHPEAEELVKIAAFYYKLPSRSPKFWKRIFRDIDLPKMRQVWRRTRCRADNQLSVEPGEGCEEPGGSLLDPRCVPLLVDQWGMAA